MLISVNKRHKIKHSGIRITGVRVIVVLLPAAPAARSSRAACWTSSARTSSR